MEGGLFYGRFTGNSLGRRRRWNGLRPLTSVRAKPAVPFGGKYRIIDFVINNFINSGLRNVKILVQNLSQPLINHVNKLWPSVPVYNFYVQAIPAQKRVSEKWC